MLHRDELTKASEELAQLNRKVLQLQKLTSRIDSFMSNSLGERCIFNILINRLSGLNWQYPTVTDLFKEFLSYDYQTVYRPMDSMFIGYLPPADSDAEDDDDDEEDE